MKKTYIVRLNDGTVGTICSDELHGLDPDLFIGEPVTVHLHDKNGNPILVEGTLADVIEEQNE
ncbi:hypothetical protein [Zobellella iuensis]|uniref:DUF2283 domain-containing protein n=1 Tax=Zobellella iuensis TaxID=2803811 RepID=A0ABS1QN95_9GAMM|nr:hypothetical protein [Zobellella iuensis]MBL1376266.1 hypothetical protein [Zobellella iuensis]